MRLSRYDRVLDIRLAGFILGCNNMGEKLFTVAMGDIRENLKCSNEKARESLGRLEKMGFISGTGGWYKVNRKNIPQRGKIAKDKYKKLIGQRELLQKYTDIQRFKTSLENFQKENGANV